MEKIALKPRHELLDPEFEGYKLSLEPLAVHERRLDGGRKLRPRTPGDDQYAFLQVKLFSSSSNLLVLDPSSSSAAYLLDPSDDSILRVSLSGEGNSRLDVALVFAPPRDGCRASSEEEERRGYNPSLSFPRPGTAAYADGRGALYFLNVLDAGKPWTVAFRGEVCGPDHPFVVASSSSSSPASSLEVLLQRVEGSGEETIVEWLSFDPSSFDLLRARRFSFGGGINYLQLVGEGSFCCLTDKPFRMTYDSSGSRVDGENGKEEEEEKKPPFFWSQTVEDIVVWVDLPSAAATKRDLKVELKPSEIRTSFRGETMFAGRLWNVVEGDTMTWTIQGGGRRLEIALCKANVGLIWQRFLREEEDGIEVSSAKELDPIVVETAAYSAQELEACDEDEEEPFAFYRFDGAKTTHRASAGGRQWICNVPMPDGAPPAVCLRHDVDGVVWAPEQRSPPSSFGLRHAGTFAALGYVQASKQQRRFTCAPPDMSFAAVCDRSRHVYVYHQPVDVSAGCELRNRTTGRMVSKVAKQHVVTLREAGEDVVGAAAANGTLFVATASSVFALTIE